VNYIISIEGQTIPVPEEIGKDDEAVKRALAPFYPEAANAMLTRVTKEETTTISVIKKAGTKGGNGLGNGFWNGFEYLVGCQGGKNAAIAMYEELQAKGEMDALELLEMDQRIDEAIGLGEAQEEQVEYAERRLKRARPQASTAVVEGF
jgi:hypothetical protein